MVWCGVVFFVMGVMWWGVTGGRGAERSEQRRSCKESRKKDYRRKDKKDKMN